MFFILKSKYDDLLAKYDELRNRSNNIYQRDSRRISQLILENQKLLSEISKYKQQLGSGDKLSPAK